MPVSSAAINNFLAERKLAVVGVSRSGKKFGNVIYNELISKGYKLFPVNPNAETIGNDKCYPDLKSLPEQIGGVVIILPPDQTGRIVQDVKALGVKQIWMQQGSQSGTAIRYCEENGISVIAGKCILMYAEPVVSIHGIHRWIWKLIGRYSK